MKKKFKTGAVLGKFYPLHKGHQYLIETGIEMCEEFYIIIGAKPDQFVTGEQRAEWVKKLYPNATVLILKYDDSIPAIDHTLWANMTVDTLGFKPDAVFSSEDYGKPWADEMGSEHVLVDMERIKIPISGTKIRNDITGNWEFMDPIVQEFFIQNEGPWTKSLIKLNIAI